MKRFLWAALLALLLFAAVEQKASAWPCSDCSGGQGHYFPCLGVVPGPWYLYWPTGIEQNPWGSFGQWSYHNHFQTPAPIGDSFCSDYGGFYPGYWYGR